jgi:chemotaxis protein histidine kinase CheA
MAVTNPYKQGETTYQDTLIKNAGIVPGSTIPVGQEQVGANAGTPVVKTALTQPKTTKPVTNAIKATATDTQMLADQAIAKQYATTQLAKTPAEQQAADLAVQQEQQKTASQAAAAKSASSGSSASTGSSQTVDATPTTTEQPATTSTTDTTATAEVQENPYQKQLETMKFDYNPQTDTQYLEDAAGLENQVVQMMVGRGGMYSSVAQSALQSRLVSLQNDFRTEKYTQFVQDRNFLFEQAKQWSTEQATKWSQQQTEKEFAFEQEKEKFDQQMAIAEYNLAVQAQQFSQSQARAAAKASSAQALYQSQLDVSEKSLSKEQTVIQKNAFTYYRESQIYKEYLARWKKTGVADSYVAKYFGVSQGASLSKSTSAVTYKAAYLDSYKDALNTAATDYNMSADLLDQVKMFQENKYVSTTPTAATTTPTSSSSWLGSTTTKTQQTR